MINHWRRFESPLQCRGLESDDYSGGNETEVEQRKLWKGDVRCQERREWGRVQDRRAAVATRVTRLPVSGSECSVSVQFVFEWMK